VKQIKQRVSMSCTPRAAFVAIQHYVHCIEYICATPMAMYIYNSLIDHGLDMISHVLYVQLIVLCKSMKLQC